MTKAFGEWRLACHGENVVTRERLVPSDPIRFIQDCIRRGRVLWTYHVNMRLVGRFIPRETILGTVENLELVEAYPDDKYLPSYLVLGRAGGDALHVLLAVDVEGDDVRVVTAYRPDAGEWHDDLKTRRPKK
jgi:uncharacterized protein DUF4258